MYLVEVCGEPGNGDEAAAETHRLLSTLPREQDGGSILRRIHRLHEILRTERRKALAFSRAARRNGPDAGQNDDSRQVSRCSAGPRGGEEENSGVGSARSSEKVGSGLDELRRRARERSIARGADIGDDKEKSCRFSADKRDGHEQKQRCLQLNNVGCEATGACTFRRRSSSFCAPRSSESKLGDIPGGRSASAERESRSATEDHGDAFHFLASPSPAPSYTSRPSSQPRSTSSFPQDTQGTSDVFFLCVPFLTALAQLSCSPPCLSSLLITRRPGSFPQKADMSNPDGSHLRPIVALDALFRLLHTYGAHFARLRVSNKEALGAVEGEARRAGRRLAQTGEDRGRSDYSSQCSVRHERASQEGRIEGASDARVSPEHSQSGMEEGPLFLSVEEGGLRCTRDRRRERGKAIWMMIFRGILFPLFDDLFLLLHLRLQQKDAGKGRMGPRDNRPKTVEPRSPQQSMIPVPVKKEGSPGQDHTSRGASSHQLSAPRVSNVCLSPEGGPRISNCSSLSSPRPFDGGTASHPRAAATPGGWPSTFSSSCSREIAVDDRSVRRQTSGVVSPGRPRSEAGGVGSIPCSSAGQAMTQPELVPAGCELPPAPGQSLNAGDERGALQDLFPRRAGALLEDCRVLNGPTSLEKLRGDNSGVSGVSLLSRSPRSCRASFLMRRDTDLLFSGEDRGGGTWIEIASWSALQQLVTMANFHLGELQFHMNEILALVLSALEEENATEGMARLGIEALSQLITSVGPRLCKDRGRGKQKAQKEQKSKQGVLTHGPDAARGSSEDQCVLVPHHDVRAIGAYGRDAEGYGYGEQENGARGEKGRDAEGPGPTGRRVQTIDAPSLTGSEAGRREEALPVRGEREDERDTSPSERCLHEEKGAVGQEREGDTQKAEEREDDGIAGNDCWETLATAILVRAPCRFPFRRWLWSFFLSLRRLHRVPLLSGDGSFLGTA